jgi:hypothetical protein
LTKHWPQQDKCGAYRGPIAGRKILEQRLELSARFGGQLLYLGEARPAVTAERTFRARFRAGDGASRIGQGRPWSLEVPR